MTRTFLDVDDLDADELDQVLAEAENPAPDQVLAGRGAALLFEKPSLRTRSSMELACRHAEATELDCGGKSPQSREIEVHSLPD